MKNLIRKILKESEDDGLDWIRDIKYFDVNKILEINNDGGVVALWFGNMNPIVISHFNNFKSSNGYYFSSGNIIQKDFLDGDIKGLTFYPNKQMGYFKDKGIWNMYNREVVSGYYVDIDPDKFVSIEI